MSNYFEKWTGTLALIPSGPVALWILRFDSRASIPLVVISISGITGCGEGPLFGKGSCRSSTGNRRLLYRL